MTEMGEHIRLFSYPMKGKDIVRKSTQTWKQYIQFIKFLVKKRKEKKEKE